MAKLKKKKSDSKPSSTVPGSYPVEMVRIENLRPHPRNYRKHPPDQLQHIEASIREHGYYRNVVATRDGTILAGHGVVEASRNMGKMEVPVVRLDVSPDDPRAMKLLVADNEIGNLAETDDRALTEMLKELSTSIDGLMGTGFDPAQFASLVFVTRPESEIQTKEHAAGWVGMPQYVPDEADSSVVRVVISFRNDDDRREFMEKIGATVINKKTGPVWSIWWPEKAKEDLSSVRFQ